MPDTQTIRLSFHLRPATCRPFLLTASQKEQQSQHPSAFHFTSDHLCKFYLLNKSKKYTKQTSYYLSTCYRKRTICNSYESVQFLYDIVHRLPKLFLYLCPANQHTIL
ncbi:hypothetical protein M076_1990 [Bacteroides fragilis str. 2-F-2 |uniref:Uncharacterized protein n=1 Tax=Bacteroides fragilis str. 2-F-2 \|nr:hypothetical protein M078_1995 [Bacteroides fragilis str. 2-F-2 \